MKRFRAVIVIGMAAWWLGMGATFAAAAPKGKVERLIEELEMRRFKAMVEADFATLETLLAADMSYSHSTGWTQTKSEFISSLRSHELEYKEIKPDVLEVRVYGTTAVVAGRARVRAKVKGQESSVEIRFLDVYVKRKGQWQMVAWQSARLAN